jgi:uncharacterized protein YjbJ (UPF0337 family)
MSTENRAKAAVKKVEGQVQETVGNATGDSEDQAVGKAKQTSGKVREGIEDAKDAVVDKARQASDKVHDAVENVKDKLKK